MNGISIVDGYILKRQENGFYAREHRLVIEKKLGRKLTKDEVVHHKNGIKIDNRPENLQVLSNAEHARIHSVPRMQEAKFVSKFKPDLSQSQDMMDVISRRVTQIRQFGIEYLSEREYLYENVTRA